MIQETAPNIIMIKVMSPPAPSAILMSRSIIFTISQRRGGGEEVLAPMEEFARSDRGNEK